MVADRPAVLFHGRRRVDNRADRAEKRGRVNWRRPVNDERRRWNVDRRPNKTGETEAKADKCSGLRLRRCRPGGDNQGGKHPAAHHGATDDPTKRSLPHPFPPSITHRWTTV